MTDAADKLMEALVTARERGLSPLECRNLVANVYAAPWSPKSGEPRGRPQRTERKNYEQAA